MRYNWRQIIRLSLSELLEIPIYSSLVCHRNIIRCFCLFAYIQPSPYGSLTLIVSATSWPLLCAVRCWIELRLELVSEFSVEVIKLGTVRDVGIQSFSSNNIKTCHRTSCLASSSESSNPVSIVSSFILAYNLLCNNQSSRLCIGHFPKFCVRFLFLLFLFIMKPTITSSFWGKRHKAGKSIFHNLMHKITNGVPF